MAVNAQQKFDCAVKVIKSLPKNGSFQPSHEMMLSFYSYYKQAVEGPCNIPQPGFWDVIGKAKWKAWHDLGDMSKDNAMLNYVEELKQIIETMPQTQMVADFMGTLGEFYEMVDERMPFTSDKASPLKSKTSPEDHLTQIDGTDFFVDTSLSHSVLIEKHLQENGMVNGDVIHDDDDDNDDDTDSDEQHLVKDDDELQHTETGSNKDGQSQTKKEKDLSASESETESEDFCDTSDEPIQLPKKPQVLSDNVESSTPIGNKTTNRVRFSDTQTVHLAPGEFSPINKSSDRLENIHGLGTGVEFSSIDRMQKVQGLEVLTGRRAELNSRVLSDSLFVNTSLHEHANTSLASQMDISADSMDLSSRSYCETSTLQGGRRGLFSTADDVGQWWGADHDTGVNKQIGVALSRLQQDVKSVVSRLSSLESAAKKKKHTKPSWWPFEGLSTRTVFFIIAWPFIAQFLISLVFRKKRIPHR
ncbi:acyl-CoA-binding domain-containing protein 5A-like isoform X2 [Gigantopelta aegis]|uniref:acyl-CoA-binding domain-containing protein 5A-like isoform X2 n=1 Tax=Gigantopelta aegis TaxID=1735272 RepID=UPI001B88A538|nr:acyl-CoA-binding domain-containing protein 5A-like isoform X2 [Gigantopelta aegis]